ncbi:MAG: tryptophan synthase subunit alpha [Anaerolineales bacterium]
MKRITKIFETTRAEGRAALMPYYPMGFPTPEESLEIIHAIANAGADLIELGIPFSDPLADGPTIQHATQTALENGMTLRKGLEITAQLRARGVQQPLILMGYLNPILAYGLENFVRAAHAAGADGFIVPDLPPEEAGEFSQLCAAHHLALIHLLAPNANETRIRQVAAQTSGFVYLVSVTGITGARRDLPPDLGAFIERVRRAAHTPIAVGFGIATPEQAQTVGALADGVIVGSALIKTVQNAQPEQRAQTAAQFVSALALSLQQ